MGNTGTGFRLMFRPGAVIPHRRFIGDRFTAIAAATGYQTLLFLKNCQDNLGVDMPDTRRVDDHLGIRHVTAILVPGYRVGVLMVGETAAGVMFLQPVLNLAGSHAAFIVEDTI